MSCGNSQDIIGDVPDNDTNTVDEEEESTITQQPEIKVETTKMKYKGVIKDESIYDECGFLIETAMMGKKVLYKPDLLDEKFKKDGLTVTFTFRKSQSRSDCPDTVPIVIETIE